MIVNIIHVRNTFFSAIDARPTATVLIVRCVAGDKRGDTAYQIRARISFAVPRHGTRARCRSYADRMWYPIILIGTRAAHKGYCSPREACDELITPSDQRSFANSPLSCDFFADRRLENEWFFRTIEAAFLYSEWIPISIQCKLTLISIQFILHIFSIIKI